MISSPSGLSCVILKDKDVDCNGESNGGATVSASGGDGSYSYAWDNGETSAAATMLNAGTHSVTITDGAGCTTVCMIDILEPTVLGCNTSVLSNVSCNGGADGVAEVEIFGGTAVYSILWSNGSTSSSVSNFGAGTHSVTVTDANGCTTSCDVVVTEPALLTCSAVGTDLMCNGDNSGEVTVTVSGGTLPYDYSIDGGAIQSGNVFSGLSAGMHIVTIEDANGCVTNCNVTLLEPAALSCSVVEDNAANCGMSDGGATVTAIGGSGSYTSYLWDNGETTASATMLSAGVHSVTVTDSDGCTTECEVMISTPSNLSCLIVRDRDVSCAGLSDGGATVSGSGGDGSYSYAWDNGETTAVATMLNAGNHFVTVTDGAGCSTVCNIEIEEPTAILCNLVVGNNVSCNGGSER